MIGNHGSIKLAFPLDTSHIYEQDDVILLSEKYIRDIKFFSVCVQKRNFPVV